MAVAGCVCARIKYYLEPSAFRNSPRDRPPLCGQCLLVSALNCPPPDSQGVREGCTYRLVLPSAGLPASVQAAFTPVVCDWSCKFVPCFIPQGFLPVEPRWSVKCVSWYRQGLFLAAAPQGREHAGTEACVRRSLYGKFPDLCPKQERQGASYLF